MTEHVAGTIKPLVWDKRGDAKGGGAKYSVYEFGGIGLWNCVCYPHEDQQYRLVEGVSQEAAKAAAQADYEQRIRSVILPAQGQDEPVAYQVRLKDGWGPVRQHPDIPSADHRALYPRPAPAVSLPEDVAGLIDNLRSRSLKYDCGQAADTIEAQAAENARLTERVKVLTLHLQRMLMVDMPSEKHNGNRNDLIAWQMWRDARAALADASKG